MDECRVYGRIYAYAVYAASVVVIVSAIALANPLLVLLSAFLLLFSVAYMHSSSIINGFLIKVLGMPAQENAYKLSEDGRAAVRRENGAYRSVSAASLRVAEGAEAGDIKNVIAGIRVPFDFTISVRQVDIKGLIDEFETKRRIKELELNRIDPKNYLKVNALKRGIEEIEAQLSALKKDGMPLEVELMLKSAAISSSFGDAASSSARQIEALSNAFSTLNLSVNVLSGEALLNVVCFG